MSQYRFKRSFVADPNVSQQMFDLLYTVFPEVKDVNKFQVLKVLTLSPVTCYLLPSCITTVNH
jgi:hypothetical protein